MTSSVPYLIRALYEWILDNNCTPYLVVDATSPDASVPQEHVQDGQIVLNISPSAVRDLQLGDEAIGFNGRFSGIATEIYLPIKAILAIYAKENGQGMSFSGTDTPTDAPTDNPPASPLKRSTKRVPSLKLIK